MAFEQSLKSISLNADSSIAEYTGVPGLPGSADPNTGKMYRFVKVTGDKQVGLCTAGTDASVGVLQNKPQNVGMAATVAIFGVSFVVAGAAVAAGAEVTADSSGRAVATTSGDTTAGVALAAASAAGELIPVLIKG